MTRQHFNLTCTVGPAENGKHSYAQVHYNRMFYRQYAATIEEAKEKLWNYMVELTVATPSVPEPAIWTPPVWAPPETNPEPKVSILHFFIGFIVGLLVASIAIGIMLSSS